MKKLTQESLAPRLDPPMPPLEFCICPSRIIQYFELIVQKFMHGWRNNYISRDHETILNGTVYIFELIYLIQSASQTCWH